MANKYLSILSDSVVIDNNKLKINLRDVDLKTDSHYNINFDETAIISSTDQRYLITPLFTINTASQSSRIINKVDYGVFYMVGAVLLYTGDTIPDGYLICNGQAVSRNSYLDLYEVIGNTYGAGDGETTFNLPDLSNNLPAVTGCNYIIKAIDENRTFDPISELRSSLNTTE